MMNEVDRLQARIAKIQGDCDHDWRLIKKPELIESFVPGVFVGRRDPVGIAPEMRLICMRCSKRLVTSIIERCPKCLSPMSEGGLYSIEDDGTFSRKKYFGQEYLYNAIRLHRCTNTKCDFVVASDEWNQ
jgi:hypothetical protein